MGLRDRTWRSSERTRIRAAVACDVCPELQQLTLATSGSIQWRMDYRERDAEEVGMEGVMAVISSRSTDQQYTMRKTLSIKTANPMQDHILSYQPKAAASFQSSSMQYMLYVRQYACKPKAARARRAEYHRRRSHGILQVCNPSASALNASRLKVARALPAHHAARLARRATRGLGTQPAACASLVREALVRVNTVEVEGAALVSVDCTVRHVRVGVMSGCRRRADALEARRISGPGLCLILIAEVKGLSLVLFGELFGAAVAGLERGVCILLLG